MVFIGIFSPIKGTGTDHFIDLNAKRVVMGMDEFHEGMPLYISGYPYELNKYEYDLDSDYETQWFTGRTKKIRKIDVCFLENDEGEYIDFRFFGGQIEYDDLNGFSGGGFFVLKVRLYFQG